MTYRVTVSLAYRSGAEVLVRDCGPLQSFSHIQRSLNDLAAALDANSHGVETGAGELVVRIARRSFERFADDPPAPAKPHRIKRPGEFR